MISRTSLGAFAPRVRDSALRGTSRALSFALLLFLLLFALVHHIPVVDSCDRHLHGLSALGVVSRASVPRPRKASRLLTVICSLKKSKSSSQFDKLSFAAFSFESRSDSASSIGYDSMTLAFSD